jgi:hypothetical protein
LRQFRQTERWDVFPKLSTSTFADAIVDRIVRISPATDHKAWNIWTKGARKTWFTAFS